MREGMIEQIVRKEIETHGDNVFTEFKTELMLSKNKIVGIYLGNLKGISSDDFKKNVEHYEKSEDIDLSDDKRDIKIEVRSLHEPVTKLWFERGFEFFSKLGEKNIKIRWDCIVERIKSSPKKADIIELIKDFERGTGRSLCNYYSDYIPLFEINDRAVEVKEFMDKYREVINLDEAELRNYSDSKELTLKIGRNLFNFQTLGTNPDAEKYAKMVDEFLE